jgi:hypothetical protein
VIGSGLTTGYGPNNYFQIASNTVNYTFEVSLPAPNEFAIFDTHNPWGYTVIKDAITAAGHTYTEFTPADLAGFDFSQYRVVILKWDDTFLFDFFLRLQRGPSRVGSLFCRRRRGVGARRHSRLLRHRLLSVALWRPGVYRLCF